MSAQEESKASAIRPDMVFSAAVAMNPELFSTIPDEAHRAASPLRVDVAREKVLVLARKALEAALSPAFLERMAAMEAENARLREALKFYASAINWMNRSEPKLGRSRGMSKPSMISLDGGKRARTTLQEHAEDGERQGDER